MKNLARLLPVATLFLLVACNQTKEVAPEVAGKLEIPFEKYTLDNGLQVILHEDHSDPIVAMATLVHVGSNRELPGKTGFAHFFEHMSFNDSENVPQGANRKMIEEWGGSRNGGTWTDGTIYYEVVPTDALEKLMWIDSDRLGYMINTVTGQALQNEKEVVKNEKRQRVDNRPYGHTGTVVSENLYPQGHPYSWSVIGSLKDLQDATLDDVKSFYQSYYGPNNATLVVAGDFDSAKVKAMIAQWFGEIKRGPDVPKLTPLPVSLEKTVKVAHLDNFARAPELSITFPTVEMYHKDSYALGALARILSEGKRAHLYKTVVEERKLAPGVRVENDSLELAGTFSITVRANKGVSLDEVKGAVDEALSNFETQGFSDKDMERIKVMQETEFYDSINSVLQKAFSLARYNTYANDPGFLSEDIARIQSVTRADIERVFARYIKGKHAVITSFVPKDAAQLILSGSEMADIFEEPIVKGAEQEEVVSEDADYELTPSSFDRSMPVDGPEPIITRPAVWEAESASGLRVLGVNQQELPMVSFSIAIRGGHFLDDLAKSGTAYLNGKLMNEGTAHKSPVELQDATGILGSRLSVYVGDEFTSLRGECLTRNFAATVALAAEMLLEPRFDAAEFARIKDGAINSARQAQANPSQVAGAVFRSLTYGKEHIFATLATGNEASLALITLADVKAYYRNNFAAKLATFHVAGAVDQETVMKAVSVFDSQWPAQEVSFPKYLAPARSASQKMYFVDIPGSKQSLLMAGLPGIGEGDKIFFMTNVAHDRLGRGSSSRLTQLLRIKKGYTYGAYSMVTRNSLGSLFRASTSVRANVTYESLELLRDELANYAETFTKEELAITKNVITKRNASRFETRGGLLRLLEDISAFNLPVGEDKNQAALKEVGLGEMRGIISSQISEKHMVYLVVGDAETQLSELGKLGYGKPILVDRTGKVLQ